MVFRAVNRDRLNRGRLNRDRLNKDRLNKDRLYICECNTELKSIMEHKDVTCQSLSVWNGAVLRVTLAG